MKPAFCLVLVVCILLIPVRLVAAWFFAAFIHELGHCFALWMCRVPIESILIGPFGTEIETGSISRKKEILCALAGPVWGLLLFLFFRYLPLTALFALFQSAMNLIPVNDRDGGRALRCLLTMGLGTEKGPSVYDIVQSILKGVLLGNIFVACFYLSVPIFAWMPLLLVVSGKIPCKLRHQIVQYRKKIPKRQDNYEENTTAHFANCTKARPLHRRRI